MLTSSLSYIASEPHEYHYRNATHVILRNAPPGSGGPMSDPPAVRALVAKLCASPSFKLLATTSPLPFQHSLVVRVSEQ